MDDLSVKFDYCTDVRERLLSCGSTRLTRRPCKDKVFEGRIMSSFSRIKVSVAGTASSGCNWTEIYVGFACRFELPVQVVHSTLQSSHRQPLPLKVTPGGVAFLGCFSGPGVAFLDPGNWRGALASSPDAPRQPRRLGRMPAIPGHRALAAGMARRGCSRTESRARARQSGCLALLPAAR